jgi:HD-GYP domain-containing protein (c-di-GMP phosphodiesterase class II)
MHYEMIEDLARWRLMPRLRPRADMLFLALAAASICGLAALSAVYAPWALALLAPLPLLACHWKRDRVACANAADRLLAELADSVDARDRYTRGHARRVAALSEQILRELGVNRAETASIVAAARYHDLGRAAIPDALLRKRGPLTEAEQQVVRSYPERGAELLQAHGAPTELVELLRLQGAAWDGSGEPDGRRGLAIPLGARVIAVADSYDAMVSHRSYRHALSAEQAAEALQAGCGRRWDPAIVDALLRSLPATHQKQAGPWLRLVPERKEEMSLAAAP